MNKVKIEWRSNYEREKMKIDCKYCDGTGIAVNGISYFCKTCKQRWLIRETTDIDKPKLGEEWKRITGEKDPQ